VLLVVPFYEVKVYQVYLDYYYRETGQQIVPAAVDRLEEAEKPGKVNYLITPAMEINTVSLEARGYQRLLTPPRICDGSRAVYFRTNP
jgi:ABC-type sulfate transport system substrate-binding protein